MNLKALQKFGGVSIILGALLFMVYAVCFNLFLPVEEGLKDFSLLINSPHWIWICSIAFPGIILMIFGFTAIYSRMYDRAGWIGFIGYIFITLAYIFQTAMLTWEIFIYPIIASHESSVVLLRDNIMLADPLFSLFSMLFMVTIVLGVFIFSIALFRSKVFHKAGAGLFLLGAVLYAVGPIFIGLLGIGLFSVGCFILGMNLIKQK